MRKIKIKRLFHGKASVRSYLVDEALLSHEDLLIVLEETGQEMIVPYGEILKRGVRNKNGFRSKHDSRTYVLVDFEFKEDERQKALFPFSYQQKVGQEDVQKNY